MKKSIIIGIIILIILFVGGEVFVTKYSNKNNVNNTNNTIPAIKEVTEPNKVIYQDKVLNGADPVLSKNMLPVYYDGDVWRKADIYTKWYSYEEFNWANVVIPKTEAIEKLNELEIDAEIKEEDIMGYFVWVPRFEYKLFNVDNDKVKEQMIEINFVNKDTNKKTTVENGLYYTHPAFTATYSNGDVYELNGFWIAKFEPSLNKDDLQILPAKHTLVNLNYKDMWNYAYSLTSIYDLDYQSRIITNMEYGAIAYLSYSQYSKKNNQTYPEKERNIFMNNAQGDANWNNVTTGCSSGKVVAAPASSCPYNYNVEYYGYGASTTGTIYGIYDIAGGSWECTMSIVGNLGSRVNVGGYRGILASEDRYYTYYKGSSNMYDYTRGQIGDATRETLSKYIEHKSWNGNLAYFATNNYPWIKRGGTFRGGQGSGLFDYGITNAIKRGDKTFRVIISEY